MNTYRQKNHQNEAGGCLFGYYRGDHIHITNCTTPQVKDIRSPYKFIRKDPYHLSIAQKLHEGSGRKCTYLGDWHTHPQEHPTPSPLDFIEWDKITKIKGKWKSIAVIVGRSNFWVGCGSCNNKIRNSIPPSYIRLGTQVDK